jgi:hypothetical protein
MNRADEANSEIAALRREVEVLREELNALKQLLGASQDEALRERQHPLALRCASLEMLGQDGAPVAALMATPEGANFALCAHDGKPRVVLQSRDEGAVHRSWMGNGDLRGPEDVGRGRSVVAFVASTTGRLAVFSVAATGRRQCTKCSINDDGLSQALRPNAVPLHSPE